MAPPEANVASVQAHTALNSVPASTNSLGGVHEWRGAVLKGALSINQMHAQSELFQVHLQLSAVHYVLSRILSERSSDLHGMTTFYVWLYME